MAVDVATNATAKSWLYHPQFPSHWKRKPLYALADWVNGLAFRDVQFSFTGKPVIKIAEIKGGISGQTKFTTQTFDKSVHITDGDLLFSWSGQPETSIDAFWWRGRDGWLNQHIFKVTPSAILDRTFFFYLLRYLRPNFVGIARNKQTTGLGHVTKRDLESIEAAYPEDVNEQRAIAHILGTLDDKIELNRHMSETLEAMARALFKSWFVDFDPVRAKMEGRDPGLPPQIANLFPNSLEDSELGEIPKGWKVGVLEDALAELEVGGRPKGGVAAYTEGVPSIGAESIVGLGVFDYSKTKYVPREYFDRMTKGHIKSRDVLLYKDGGRPGEFEPHVTLFGDGFPFETAAINEHVYRLRAKSCLSQEFLFFWLSSDLVMEEMRIKGTGVAIPGLNSTQVKSLTTLIPPTTVVKAFAEYAEPYVARVLATCNESHTLSTLRDTLLPKLISGQLRVRDTEKFAGAMT